LWVERGKTEIVLMNSENRKNRKNAEKFCGRKEYHIRRAALLSFPNRPLMVLVKCMEVMFAAEPRAF